jgi:two-component system sensor histidine kinase KdpD
MEEIVGSVLGRLHARDSGARILALVEPGLPLVRGDATLLAQLLTNLLDNARRYGADPLELAVRAAPQGLLVSVKDRGPGIAAEDEARLFEPFFRGRHETGERGAGLGLALCKAIAEAHGGQLEMRRRPRGGCCFTLTLAVDAQQPTEPTE